MSKISSSNENQINFLDSNNLDSSNPKRSRKIYFYGSEQKVNPILMYNDENEDISNKMLNFGYNSCSINGNNKLFKSLINSKNNKNKELSLLYLINTFNKSYSNESNEKNIIIDLPKISKKLFSNSHTRYKSSTNLDAQTFQKNLRLSKCGGEIVNNFFSSIYAKQCSGDEISTISPKRVRRSKASLVNSGNKLSKNNISPFTNNNLKLERLFSNNINSGHENNEFNFEFKELKKSDEHPFRDKLFNSSLLMGALINDESKKN